MFGRFQSKRRVAVYVKCAAFILLAIFYFTFLFRESLNAFEENKEKGTNTKQESKPMKPAKLLRRHYSANIINNALNINFASQLFTYSSEFKTRTSKLSSTLNPIYEYSEEIHSATERKLHERTGHLNEICQKQNLHTIYPPKPWEFFVSPGHNLVWCNIFKAASSTWMYYFNILAGYDMKYLQRTQTSGLELARKRFPRPQLFELYENLASSLSFLCVREPFERLISAYRDKIEGCHNKYYKVLGKQIILQFRKGKGSLRRHNSGPSFKEFIKFIIHNHMLNKTFDEHWAPMYSFCTPCSINFTLIAKVETFQRDSEYIIRQAGLEPLLLGKLPKSRKRKISNQSAGYNTGSLIEKYFSQLDRHTLNQLINIYRLDFELFDYNITKYYDLVQQPIITIAPISLMFNISAPINNFTVEDLL